MCPGPDLRGLAEGDEPHNKAHLRVRTTLIVEHERREICQLLGSRKPFEYNDMRVFQKCGHLTAFCSGRLAYESRSSGRSSRVNAGPGWERRVERGSSALSMNEIWTRLSVG